MSKLETLLTVAVAVTFVAMTSGDCSAQDSVGSATIPPIVSASTFGYPAVANCGSCGDQGCGRCRSGRNGDHPRMAAMKAHHHELAAHYHKIYGRNNVWPMPWNCADRQLYFQIWEPMIDRGFEEQCVLNSAHFDSETNELNKFGQHAVAGIMQNMPTTRQHVFIHREANDRLNQARLASVRDTINTFYGQQLQGPARVSFSTRLPNTITGDQAEGINRLWFEKMPSPVIPISSGETINSAVGGN
jgi:hypothetical protein